MNVNEVIRLAINGAHKVMLTYLSDLDDAELLMRVNSECNHPAWQLGHLISSEYFMMEGIRPGVSPKLPTDFTSCYSKDKAKLNDPTCFHTKAQYLELYDKQRRATLEILESLTPEDLDAPGPERMRSYAPTVGSLMILQGNHEMMHAGQLVPLRRKLGKAVLI